MARFSSRAKTEWPNGARRKQNVRMERVRNTHSSRFKQEVFTETYFFLFRARTRTGDKSQTISYQILNTKSWARHTRNRLGCTVLRKGARRT